MSSDFALLREFLGRDPTLLEEALAIYLIRIGLRYEVERIIGGGRADGADAIRATYDVADLITEQWESLSPGHQDAIRVELRRVLWRIEGRELRGSWVEAMIAVLSRDAPDLA